jgi:two-component system, sensor histidine kinase YesM
MLRKLINQFLKMKFYNKVFLLYSGIVISALIASGLIITNNTVSSSLERDIRYVKLVLYNVSSMFDQKERVMLQLAKQTYSNTSLDRRVFEFLETDSDPASQEYLEMRKHFTDYLESAFGNDAAIKCVTVYKKEDETFYLISKKINTTYSKTQFNHPEILNQFKNFSPKVILYPSSRSIYSKNGYVYTMAMNIKSMDTFNNVGTLILDFDVEGITKSILQYYNELSGDIIVINSAGNVVYDSSNTYYGKTFPYYSLLKSGDQHLTINGQDCIVNRIGNSNLGITAVGIMPVNKALEKISRAKKDIFIISFLCIFAAMQLAFLSSKISARRINSIMAAIKKIRHGDLKSRIPLGQSRDELYVISESLNKMCGDIEKYIDQVYVSEIHQKNAELTALQAQINPHFLYNTLEAIRMKANIGGAKEAGDMILILSKLFRSSIKDDTITDIHEEIEYAMLYLELYTLRYNSKLAVTFEVDQDILEFGIIRHVFQPIIENYIIHGFDSSNKDNLISIKGHRDKEHILISIDDNGNGISPIKLAIIQKTLESTDIRSTQNIGLANVNERIKIIFGQQCGLKITSEENIGTTVKIKILAKTVEELKTYVQSTHR